MSSRSIVRPEGSPTLRYCHNSYTIKEEDIVFVHSDLQALATHTDRLGKWDLFCLCDGHGGREAAEFTQKHLPSLLAQHLPHGESPEPETREGKKWLEATRRAIDKAFIQLDVEFRKECVYPNVGCTLTIALFSGWILTIANVGDSEGFLDLGNGKAIEVTTSDKIDTNKSEQDRLRSCGNRIGPLSEGLARPAMSNEEGVGPLRVWPSGLAVSRAIGDQDCGNSVLASPHIKQIKLPFAGARLAIASDGLWDHLSPERVIKRSRKHSIEDVPAELISKAREVSEFGLTDDTSVLVVDIVPTPKMDFKDISKKVRGPKSLISMIGKKLGRNKAKGLSSVVLVDTDMAPVPKGSSNSVTPFLNINSIPKQNTRSKDTTLTRHKTCNVAAEMKDCSSIESEDNASEGRSNWVGVSLNLDQDEGSSSQVVTRSLERFRSSIVN